MGVERRGKKWVARLSGKAGRRVVGVFGSEAAAIAGLRRAEAEVVAGVSPLVGPMGTVSGQAFAASIGVRYGTLRRWTHEGMPTLRIGGVVHIDPVAAGVWIDANRRDSIAAHRSSVVYIMQRDSDGAFKIGWSSDIARRLTELRVKGRCEVALVAAFPGGKTDENRLHARFESDRISGEWYRSSEGIRSFIHMLVRSAA